MNVLLSFLLLVTAGRLKINEEFKKNRNVTDIGEIEEVSQTRNKCVYILFTLY